MDGPLAADEALDTSTVTGAVVVVPLRRSSDLLQRLDSDELLRERVSAVLVVDGEEARLCIRSLTSMPGSVAVWHMFGCGLSGLLRTLSASTAWLTDKCGPKH